MMHGNSNIKIIFVFHKKVASFFTGLETVSYWRRTLLYGVCSQLQTWTLHYNGAIRIKVSLKSSHFLCHVAFEAYLQALRKAPLFHGHH